MLSRPRPFARNGQSYEKKSTNVKKEDRLIGGVNKLHGMMIRLLTQYKGTIRALYN